MTTKENFVINEKTTIGMVVFFFVCFFLFMRQQCQVSSPLLHDGLRVTTNFDENHEKTWNVLKTVITLHQKSEMISLFDLLIQKKYKVVILSTLSAYYISLRPD